MNCVGRNREFRNKHRQKLPKQNKETKNGMSKTSAPQGKLSRVPLAPLT
jgi:hypothetical protein